MALENIFSQYLFNYKAIPNICEDISKGFEITIQEMEKDFTEQNINSTYDLIGNEAFMDVVNEMLGY